MKKSKFIKSSIILIIGGLFTKVLGMLVKIVLTRKIGTQGIGLYSLISPTFLLLISISGMGLTTALNVLISSKKYNVKNIIIYALFISLSMDLLIIIFLFLFSKSIAVNLLNNEMLYVPILSMGFVLPFISISNIFRSYYFSNERMVPHVVSNIMEDVVKLLLLLFFIDYVISNTELSLTFIIMTNVFSELSSIIIFLACFPKFEITKKDLKFNKRNIKAIFKISIPTTISRLIGSITYFLEPIILTYMLTKVGYTNDYIISEYGIINGYVLPIILLPSFLTNAISQALIPSISESYYSKKYSELNSKINQALMISLFLGIFFTIIFIFGGDFLLNVMYKTNEGSSYIKLVAPIFIFHYIEQPLLSTLQAMNKAKINMKISLINMIIRTLGLAILCSLKIKLYSLIIALSLNIIFTCLYAWWNITKIIEKEQKKQLKKIYK